MTTHGSRHRDAQGCADATTGCAEIARCWDRVGRVAQVGHWCWRLGDDAWFLSAESYRILGLDATKRPAAPVSLPAAAVVADRPLAEQALKSAMTGRLAPYDIEYRIARPDGAVRWVHVRGEVTWSADGAAMEVGGTLRDVTSERDAQERVELLGRVLDSVSDAVLVTDLDGTIVDVNAAFTSITGYSRDEVVGNNPRMLKSGRHPSAFYREMWRTLRERGHWEGEVWDRRRDGELLPKWLTINTIADRQRRPVRYVGVFSDLRQLKRNAARLRDLGQRDPVTGLPNRLVFEDRVSTAIASDSDVAVTPAILLIGLDRFGQINESHGHVVGDCVLREVAERLRAALQVGDSIARFGGDEYAVLVRESGGPQRLASLAQALLDTLRDPVLCDGSEIFAQASVGIAAYPTDGDAVVGLLRSVAAALREAKAQGTRQVRFCDPSINAMAVERLRLEADLRRAFERDEFVVYYQPRVSPQTGEVVAAEALVRWEHPEDGLRLPGQFIPVVEENGQVVALGRWVLEQACREASAWERADSGPIRVSVNVSPRQLHDGAFVDTVRDVLARTGLAPDRLELELTESALASEGSDVGGPLRVLRELGVRIAIDDFGTGLSSLSRLRELPADVLKIDRSFMRDVEVDTGAQAIVRAIATLGRSLGMAVVAEGVETEAQATVLRAADCDELQGFLFDRPQTAEAMKARLESARRDAREHR